MGPESVRYEITSEALCFGGQTTTATDVAIAAGVAPSNFCTVPQALSSLSPDLVRASMDEIKKKLERIIDSMKVHMAIRNVYAISTGNFVVKIFSYV